MKKAFLLFCCGCALHCSRAQPYSIDWHKIAGGGGTSTNHQFILSGTIGQPDAGRTMTNSQFTVTGAFWAWPTLVQTPGAPTLYITNAAPGFVTLWWTPVAAGFHLLVSDTLTPPTWVDVPGGTNNLTTVPATSPARFYRLVSP